VKYTPAPSVAAADVYLTGLEGAWTRSLIDDWAITALAAVPGDDRQGALADWVTAALDSVGLVEPAVSAMLPWIWRLLPENDRHAEHVEERAQDAVRYLMYTDVDAGDAFALADAATTAGVPGSVLADALRAGFAQEELRTAIQTGTMLSPEALRAWAVLRHPG
jgi:hypothetical protein